MVQLLNQIMKGKTKKETFRLKFQLFFKNQFITTKINTVRTTVQ